MNANRKLNIEEIKVESFVTSLQSSNGHEVKGGSESITTGPVCKPTIIIACVPSEGWCPSALYC